MRSADRRLEVVKRLTIRKVHHCEDVTADALRFDHYYRVVFVDLVQARLNEATVLSVAITEQMQTKCDLWIRLHNTSFLHSDAVPPALRLVAEWAVEF